MTLATMRFYLAVLLGICLLSLCKCQERLVLLPNDTEHRRGVGEGLVLSCIANSADISFLLWYDNNNILIKAQSSTENRIFTKTTIGSKKLYVTKLQLYDEGLYTCKMEKNGVVMHQVFTKLITYGEINFVKAPSSQYFAVEFDGLILCEVSGSPQPQVTWFFNGTEVISGGRYFANRSGLLVRNMVFSDTGLYLCNAEIGKSGQFKQQIIIVETHVIPQLTKELSIMHGIEGTDFGMSCQATGYPSPKYSFAIQEHPLVNGSRINVNEITGQVYFAPLSRNDEGTILCTAYNDVGKVVSLGYLNVLIPPNITSFADVVAREDEEVVMNCFFEGRPFPTVTIQKHEDPMFVGNQVKNNSASLMYEANNVLLKIHKMKKYAAGLYTCFGSSDIGIIEENATLYFEYKPQPVFNQPTNTYTWAEQTRNISCTVESHPPPNFQWLLYGEEVKNNETFRIFNVNFTSHLQVYVKTVTQSWIYAKFTCRASNSVGSVDIPIKLERASMPNYPENISVLFVYPTEVVLHVQTCDDDDGGMPVILLKISYDDKVEKFQLSDEVKIRNLKPGTRYSFKVQAGNEVGFGPGLTVNVSTEPSRIPYPIKITSHEDSSESHSYHATWNESVDVGLPVKEYKLMYRQVRVGMDRIVLEPLEDWKVIFLDGSVRLTTVNQLRYNSYYQLEIYAKNHLGWSEASQSLIFKTAKGVDMSENYSNGGNSIHDFGDFFQLPVVEKQQIKADIIIGIVVVVIIIFFVIVDISCYFIRGCSILVRVFLLIFRKNNKFNDQNGRRLLVSDQICPERDSLNKCASSLISKDHVVALSSVEVRKDYHPTISSSTSQITSSNKSEVLTSQEHGSDEDSIYVT